MSVTSELQSVTFERALVIVLAFVGLTAPGALALWIYAPELVYETSTSKLIFLATILTAPLAVLSTVILGFFYDDPEDEDKELVLKGLTALSLAAYPSLAAAFYFGWEQKVLFLVVLIVAISFSLLMAYGDADSGKKIDTTLGESRPTVLEYPVCVHVGNEDHAHGVTVPDFPGCFSSADNWDDLPRMIQEAIALHMEGENMDFPEPSSVDVLRNREEYQGGVWMWVEVSAG